MDLSTRLSCLFGTEEYVSMRRQLVLLREKLVNHKDREINIVCSGSLGEGVAYPKSDDDVMISQIYFRVVMTYREATQAFDLLIVPSEFSLGYCRLLDMNGSYRDNIIQIIHEMPFVSSSLWKQRFAGKVEGVTDEHIHGPCQSGTFGDQEYDITVCIPCNTWPDIANGWVNRERPFEWPSFQMIQNIIGNGCHVVPVGDPDSPFCLHEWRISFSVAERSLMHSFNHAQFLVYNLLRLTLKRIIEQTIPDILCSYFMKTTLFYTAENTPKELWRENNLETCFKVCVSVLYDYVDNRYCPNYFIPEYNMIKRKVNHTNRHQMLGILRYVHRIGIVGVMHLSGESSCLNVRLSTKAMECKLDRDFLLSAHFEKVTTETIAFFVFLQHGHPEFCILYLYKLWHLLQCNATIIRSEFIDIIWNRGINSCSVKMMDYIFTSLEMNKHRYRWSKTLEALLRMGFRGDLTTRKLTMATYMYQVGKRESVFYVIRQLLSEYPPYAIDSFPDELKTQTYIDVICGRGYTINYKVRHANAPRYIFLKLCLNAFPSPLKIWITISENFLLDPVTYAYFLESLCHVHCRNQFMFMKSLKCLVNHMGDQKKDNYIIDTRMCVGIIKYVQGDNQSACRWLGSVYVMKDTCRTSKPISALTYIACLLNKKFNLLS